MKKKIVIILVILIFVTVAYAANVKWTALAELTTIADADVLCIVDDVAGTPTSKKITVLNLFDTIDTFAELNTIVDDKTLVNEEDAVAWDALGTFGLGLTITTGDPFTLGVIRWDNGSDKMDGEQIANDTIDNDSIDWGDMTDLTTDGALDADVVDEAHIADNGIDSEHYNDGSIDLVHLAAAAYAKDLVTTAPITGAADNIFVGADSDVTVALDFTAAWNFNGNISIGNATTTAGVLTLLEDDDDGANFASFMVPALTANTVYTLPPDDGDNTEVLQTDGSGTLTWVANAGGATAYDDIGDPDAASSITFDDDETVTWATAEDSAGSFFTINNSDADLAANTYLMHLIYSVDDDQANADYFKCEDAGGVVFTIQQDGDTVTTGDFQAASLTDGTATLTGGALTGLTTALTVAQGGTGATSLNDGFVLLGNATGAVQTLDVTTDGGIIIGDGTTDPVVLDVGSSTAITILGTVATGIWQATAIADGYVPNNITIDLATLATTVTVSDDESTDDDQEIVFTTDNTNLESDGDFHYSPDTGTVTATEFVGGGASLTAVDAATGDSATAFFDAGTIEHEWGGLQADISGYTGLIAITGADTTVEIDSLDELEGQLADVTRIVSEAVMPVASTDPDVDAAGELSVDTDGANEPNDVVLRTIDGNGTQVALAQEQKSIQATIIKPNDLANATRDLCPIWSNETGMSFVITKIEAWSDTDDTTVNVEVYDSVFGNNATVDALEIAGDGTANYYVTETTITAATILANYIVVLDFDDTDDPGWVKISICGYFLADVD